MANDLVLATKKQTLVQLSKMELEIDARGIGFQRVKDVMKKAESMRVLHAESTEVRRKAEWVIAKCARRIGIEIDSVPKANERNRGEGARFNASSNRALGRGDLGIPGHVRSRYIKLKDNAPDDESLARYIEPIWGANKAATVHAIVSAIADKHRADRRNSSRNAFVIPDGLDFRQGDCREVLADVADGSVALVLTDPPYEEDAAPLYRWLAEWSARVLIPGGSLICFTGHWSINRDVRIFDEHLRYWWILALMHGLSKRLPGKFIMANFKPVLWYVKEYRRGKELIPDVLRSIQDKEQHDWGQGEAGTSKLIEDLTQPGELIADPFAGSCLWGKISHSMGRRWIGADTVVGGSTTVVS